MNLNEMSKNEATTLINKLGEKLKNKIELDEFEDYFLGQIQYYVEQKVIGDIRKRQEKIPDLYVNYRAIWGTELTPGCKNCLDGPSLISIRSASKCNLNCKFCYHYNTSSPILLPDHYIIRGRLYTSDDIKMMIDKQGNRLKGLSWVHYEPFLEFNKHPKLIEYISNKGIHQHLYTNGTLCNEEQFKILKDCGLTEIRFNLAATNCSRNVLEIMKIARKYFKYLCIESPMTKEYYDSFIENAAEIVETGVDHINCAELHIKFNHTEFLKKDLYKYKYGYVSPIESRQLTYDLIEKARRDNWKGITILDCSNETKYYRSINRNNIGYTTWKSEYFLPAEWYEDVINKYDAYFKTIFNNKLRQ